ncbi:T9SS type B sorting domain-containing protein [Olleya sp. R77988]|uniref:T9SS type B sorting domain-containing protein n=1 Tax=Olleya sp. R77988 TaxID=3093875 RepID=UPI0037CBDA64
MNLKSFSFSALFLLFSILSFGQVTPTEKTALQAIFNSLDGPNWNRQNTSDTTNNWDFIQPNNNSSSLYSINYMSNVNGAIVGDGTTNTDYFGPNNWGGNYGDCTSGNWRWIHALCSECLINNKDVSVKQNNNNGSTWYAGGGASRYMVIDLSMSRTFNELRVFQMFSDGKVTSLRMYSHLNTTTVPFYSDTGWTPIFTETTIGAGVITGDTVSMPTIINFPYTTSRFLLIEAKNDGSLGNPSYTEIRELKLFDNNSATPAPIDSTETPTFTQVTPICEGGILNALPTTSDNGITGIWSPALNTTATTEYTFTPDLGQCATTNTMTITVNPAPAEPTGLECWETAAFNNATCSWDVTGTQPNQPTLECWKTATFNTTTCTWDVTGTQPNQPTLECWETSTFNNATCSWDATGTQPNQPTLECWETSTFNNATCSWDVTGTQPNQPTLECWETAIFNNTTCSWDVTGTQTNQPTLECWETSTFNNATCSWDVTGTQPNQPTLECWETAIFNNTTCSWDVTGTQPNQPTLECWETSTFNNATCSWDVTGTQPNQPTLECWETSTFNNATCSWDVTGTQPNQPTLECWETAIFNNTTCSWDVTGTQPNQPTLECWETAIFNNTTCSWDVIGTQPNQPTLECWETATFNSSTCSWDVIGTQPNQPTLECWENATFNNTTCSWDVTGTQPIFDLTESNIEIDIQDLTVYMDDNSIDYEYSVDGINFQLNHQFFDLDEGNYTLYVQDYYGCIQKEIDFEIFVIRFKVPKFFTPNNDSTNDYWQVLDVDNTIKTIQIFDRYGKLIKQISPNSLGWDGTFNGKPLITNDYWYIIQLNSEKYIKGHFTLKR